MITASAFLTFALSSSDIGSAARADGREDGSEETDVSEDDDDGRVDARARWIWARTTRTTRRDDAEDARTFALRAHRDHVRVFELVRDRERGDVQLHGVHGRARGGLELDHFRVRGRDEDAEETRVEEEEEEEKDGDDAR